MGHYGISELFFAYGLAFHPNDLHVAATAWKKFKAADVALKILAQRKRENGKPSKSLSIESLPTEIVDMCRAQLRDSMLKEAELSEADLIGSVDESDVGWGDIDHVDAIYNIQEFIEYHGFMLLANAGAKGDVDPADSYTGYFEPWIVSVPLYRGEEVQACASVESSVTMNTAGIWEDNPLGQKISALDRSVLEVATPETDRKFIKFCRDWNLKPAKANASLISGKASQDENIVVQKPSFMVVNSFYQS